MYQLSDDVPGRAGVPEGMVEPSRRWTVLSTQERRIREEPKWFFAAGPSPAEPWPTEPPERREPASPATVT